VVTLTRIYTRGGDRGQTSLGDGSRVAKHALRVEAYGTVDEAVAALGLARANLGLKRRSGTLTHSMTGLADLVLRFQRELFVAGAELASNPDARERLVDGQTRVSAAMVQDVERLLLELEGSIEMPREFVVPGETPTSAALELARTILRRAERRAVTLRREGLLAGEHVVPYLNRLADLVWVLARAAEQAESRRATPARTTPARTTPARTTATRSSSASQRTRSTMRLPKEEST
jgi:cob(I)alamin adenosyltransferase